MIKRALFLIEIFCDFLLTASLNIGAVLSHTAFPMFYSKNLPLRYQAKSGIPELRQSSGSGCEYFAWGGLRLTRVVTSHRSRIFNLSLA